MKIYKNKNVFEEALDRIRFIYDEFDNVVVCFSGGKDSTVIFNLALMIAQEKGRLPLKVMFIDQEAEWQSTVDIMRYIMYRDDVQPYWYQMPIRLFNATSYFDEWLYCWEEGGEWLRDKEPIAITENNYGTFTFKDLFVKIPEVEFRNEDCAFIGGVRAEESPGRQLGLTGFPVHKWATWGNRHYSKNRNPHGKPHVTFYPIYDWSYTDVWKAIHENNWEYNKLYDEQYRLGIPVLNMRVSNLHHETALQNIFYVQEVEPETYEKLTRRLQGIDAASKLGFEDYFPKKLPFMFADWKEYRDFLLEKLIEDEEKKELFRKEFRAHDRDFGLNDKIFGTNELQRAHQAHVSAILANDYHGTKLGNLRVSLDNARKRRARKKYLEELKYAEAQAGN